MNKGSKRWLPSSHPLGYTEAGRKTKMPLKPKLRYTPTKGNLGISLRSNIGRMPGDRTSRSLDASLAIPTRVLHLEASGARRPQTGRTGSTKPVRPVLARQPCLVFGLSFVAQPSNPVIFW
jgi:hypothetical protein